MKLLIGIPSLDYVHVDSMKCLLALTKRLQRKQVNFDTFVCSGTLAHVARDKVACKAINEGYTHVLWLDADMIYTDEVFEDLQFCEKQFVTGLAASRRPPFKLCIFKDLRLDFLENWKFEDVPDEAFRVAGCGFACVLIDTEILRAVQMHFKTCFLPMAEYGEDLAFCLRAQQMGYDIWAEPTVRLGHIGHNAVWPEDHQRYMESIYRG